jgi:hypothetical protein
MTWIRVFRLGRIFRIFKMGKLSTGVVMFSKVCSRRWP